MVSERYYGCIFPIFTTILGLITSWILSDDYDEKTDPIDEVFQRVERCTGVLQCGWATVNAYTQFLYGYFRYSAGFTRGLINICVTLYTMGILTAYWWPWANRARIEVTQTCTQGMRQDQQATATGQSEARVNATTSDDQGAASQPATVSVVQTPEPVKTVGTWNHRLHERIFQKLEFEVPDRAGRIRQLMKYFNEDDAFGGAALAAIRTICLHHLRGRSLACSEAQDPGVDWSNMWSDVKTRFEGMTLSTEDDDSVLDALRQIKRERDESWLMMLNRYHVVYSTQGQTVSRSKAVEILLRKLDMELVRFIRSQASKEDLTFEMLMEIFRQYGGYEELTKANSAEGTRQKKSPPVCFACRKPGHIERDCPEKQSVKQLSYADSRVAPNGQDEQAELPATVSRQEHSTAEPCISAVSVQEQPVQPGARFEKEELSTAGSRMSMGSEERPTAGINQTETRAAGGATRPHGLLHVSAMVWAAREYKKRLQLLIDTGASISLLPTRLVKRRAWPIGISDTICVASYSGQVERTIGTVTLQVTLGDRTREVIFHVVDVAKEPILGLNGLSSFGAMIDCDRRKLNFENGSAVMCSAVHDKHRVVQCKVVTQDEAERLEASMTGCSALVSSCQEDDAAMWIEELEERGVQPFRRDNVLYCPVGRSTVLPPGRVTGIQLPYRFLDESVQLSGTGNGSVVVIGGVRAQGQAPRIQLINLGRTAEQIGSKCGVVATLVEEDRKIFYRKVNGQVIEIRAKRHAENKAFCASVSLETLNKEFPAVLNEGLGQVRHYAVAEAGVSQEAPWGKLRSNGWSASEKEILGPLVEDLLRHGIAERVDQKPKVVTPMLTVAKSDGQRRLVHDFRLLNAVTEAIHNSALDRMRLLGSVPRCSHWTAVDLAKGYNQVALEPQIRGFFGFEYDDMWFQFARVPFGWVNSGAHFQNALAETLNRVRPRLPSNVFLAVYVDDILIGAQDEDSHDEAMKVLLTELQEDGWTINPKKMRYKQTSIEFLGHQFGPDGIRPAEGLLRKIADLPQPTSKNDLRSFFGLMVQVEKFCYRQHLIVEELRTYLQKPPEAFQTPEFAAIWKRTVKEACNQLWTLDYYRPGQDLMMMVDASGSGVGAALFCGDQPIAMFSRKTQQQWAHSADTEIDGILKALDAFEMWIAGKPVKVLTDNWCAYRAMNFQNLGKPVMRRLAHILAHNPNVEFVAGKDNTLADMLSRDAYLLRGTSATISAVGDIDEVIREIHEDGHVGVGAIASILKRRGIEQKGMYKQIRRIVSGCPTCQRWQKRHPHEDLGFNEAKTVSGVVGIDFVGPLKQIKGRKGRHLVVLVDGLSRYMEAFPVSECSTANAVKALQSWKQAHGAIQCLISDAGSCFASREFGEYCKKGKLEHKMAGPGHQSSNGLVERAIKTLIERVKKTAFHEDRNWAQVWRKAVEGYNMTPHSVTTFAPRELRYGETEGGWLDEPELERAREIAIRRTAQARERWQKHRSGKIKQQRLEVGDEVWRYDPGGDKMAVQWSGPYVIHDTPHQRLYRIRRLGSTRPERLLIHGDELVRVLAQDSVSENGPVEGPDDDESDGERSQRE